jgi:Spy/CpxP family protein refolding chaperone
MEDDKLLRTDGRLRMKNLKLIVFVLFIVSNGRAQVPADREGLFNSEGMGQATYAEMNGYPGPKHVLELEKDLELTDSQSKVVQSIFNEMRFAAMGLGKLIVSKEEDLNEVFSKGTATVKTVQEVSEQIGKLRGRLRAVHLEAHLKTRRVLTKEQIETYKRLRGIQQDHDMHHH